MEIFFEYENFYLEMLEKYWKIFWGFKKGVEKNFTEGLTKNSFLQIY